MKELKDIGVIPRLKDVIEIDLPITKRVDTELGGISPITFDRYSISYNEDGSRFVIPYKTSRNKIVAYKTMSKTDNTDFTITGDLTAAMPFGLNIHKGSNSPTIAITLSEFDALVLDKVLKGKYPVISMIDRTPDQIKQHLTYISKFQKVIFCFDESHLSPEIYESFLMSFKPQQIHFMDMRKEPSLGALHRSLGRVDASLYKIYAAAEPFVDEDIITGASLTFDRLFGPDKAPKATFPYPELNKMLGGIRGGEVMTFTAESGVGKSTICKEIAYDFLVNQDLKVGYIGLEEPIERTALGLISIDMDVPLHLEERLEEELAKGNETLQASLDKIGTDNFVMLEHFGSLGSDVLTEKIRFMRQGLGVDFIVLDHLSIAISGTQMNDERKAIDVLMTDLQTISKETGVGILLVSHLKRTNKKTGEKATRDDLRGSGAILQNSHSVVYLHRDMSGEAKNPMLASIDVWKNRRRGTIGAAGWAMFSEETGRLSPLVGSPPSEEDTPPKGQMTVKEINDAKSNF